MSSDLKRKKRQLVAKQLKVRETLVCYLCRQVFPEDKLEVEHKLPKSRGGSDHISNLSLSCKPCNTGKANMTEDEYREYLLVKSQYVQPDKVRKIYKGRVSGPDSQVTYREKREARVHHALSDYWPNRENDDEAGKV